MYHRIEFLTDFVADLEISPKHRLERTLIRQGSRLQVQIKPYVLETEEGLLAEGTVKPHKSPSRVWTE